MTREALAKRLEDLGHEAAKSNLVYAAGAILFLATRIGNGDEAGLAKVIGEWCNAREHLLKDRCVNPEDN